MRPPAASSGSRSSAATADAVESTALLSAASALRRGLSFRSGRRSRHAAGAGAAASASASPPPPSSGAYREASSAPTKARGGCGSSGPHAAAKARMSAAAPRTRPHASSWSAPNGAATQPERAHRACSHESEKAASETEASTERTACAQYGGMYSRSPGPSSASRAVAARSASHSGKRAASAAAAGGAAAASPPAAAASRTSGTCDWRNASWLAGYRWSAGSSDGGQSSTRLRPTSWTNRLWPLS